MGAPKNPKHLLFSPPPAAGFFPLHKGRRASRAALRAAQENWNPAKCLEKGLETLISRGKTVRNAQKVLKNASAIPDFAPGDTRGGPQCRGNARKRPPKPPIWRKKCYEHPQKPGKRPAGSRGIVKCLEKAPKVLETPPKSRFAPKSPDSAGIPQRPLPAQVTGGAASKKPKKRSKTTVFSQLMNYLAFGTIQTESG